MQLFDIGVNLTNNRLLHDMDLIIEQAQQAGVVKMLVTGTDLQHSQQAVKLCEQYPDILFSTAGVHPHDASGWSNETASSIEQLAKHPQVKCIGETGLDFNRNYSPQNAQIDAFTAQLNLAATTGKALFLHQRDAFDCFYSILSEYRSQLGKLVVHCFTDSREALVKLLDLDCHIGITGWICDEKRGKSLQQLVSFIPEERLMLETDAPYLYPKDLPSEQKRPTNFPKYLPHILTTVARHRNENPQVLAEAVYRTTENFLDLQD